MCFDFGIRYVDGSASLLMWRGIDEADGVIVMVSDWLELDAADDWVRHDSEIVSA